MPTKNRSPPVCTEKRCLTRNLLTSANSRQAYETEPGDNAPTEFAPSYPTEQDLNWPKVLENVVLRLVSTVRGTPTPANSQSSLSSAVTEIVQSLTGTQSHPESTPDIMKVPSHRPVNRDTQSNHPHNAGSGHPEPSDVHSQGDSEMPSGSTHGSTTVTAADKVQLPSHSDRQSPNPTALLAHQGNRLMRTYGPKRVADSERQNHTTNSTHNICRNNHFPPSPPATDNLDIPHATVATKTTHSPSQFQMSKEPEGARDSPQPIQETMGKPNHALANRTSTTLAKQRSTLDTMCTDIINATYKINNYITHMYNCEAQEQVTKDTHWQSTRSIFQSYI